MNMIDDMEKKWQETQIAWWKQDKAEIVAFFKRFGLDISDFYDQITSIDYDRMQVICYLLSKIVKAIKICDFLDTLEKNEYDDVDVVKIYMLVSHAEITMNNLRHKGSGRELVRLFFKPVEDKCRLQYIIQVGLSSIKGIGVMDFADILYKIRCQYTHEGDYTGKIFKKRQDDVNTGLIFMFRDNGKDVAGESYLTYSEFMSIYMDALIANIREFLKVA